MNEKEKQILKTLLEHDYSLNTGQVVKLSGISWNTAKKYLQKFQSLNWIEKRERGNRIYWRAYLPKPQQPKNIRIQDYPYWIIDILETHATETHPGLIQTHAEHAETIEEAQKKAERIRSDKLDGHTRHAIITQKSDMLTVLQNAFCSM